MERTLHLPWRLLLCLFVVALGICTPNSSASAAPPAGITAMPVYPNQDAASLHEVIRFRSIDDERGQELARVVEEPNSLQALAGDAFNLGPAIGRFLVVVSVVNKGEHTGEWLITTNRGAMRDFALDEWQGGQIISRIDGQDSEQVGEILQAYHSFTHGFALEPGQTRTFLVSFEAVHSTLVPLEVKTMNSLSADRFSKLAIYVGSSIGMLTIILISMVIYAQTGRPQFFWMGIAELAHVAYVAHVGGYTTFYFLYDKGPWIHITGNTLPQIFAIAMAQFGRSFINTKSRFRGLDRALLGFIVFGIAIIVVQMIKNLLGDPVAFKIVDILNGVGIMGIVLLLPYIAVIATTQLGRHYWPLIIAWGSLCLFVLYGTITAFGIAPSLPYSWDATGPIGLLETIFAFWALILYLNTLNQERMQSQIELNASLKEQLRVKEQSLQLEIDKQDALSTIRDQENLIHASGHDSQHVLMALRTIIKFSDDEQGKGLSGNLPEMLKSSAEHLEGIIGTTLANPVAGFQSGDFVALSTFSASEFLDGLERIFGPAMRAQEMGLTLSVDPDLTIVCDRSILARIASNILSNCLVHAPGCDVEVSLRSKSGEVLLEISDGGPGLPDHVIARLNDPEEDRMGAREVEKGSGFGLLSSQRLTRAIYGQLDAIKRKGPGATFLLTIPHLTPPPSGAGEMTAEQKLREELSEVRIVDLDRISSVSAEIKRMKEEPVSNSAVILPISSDASSQMRGRLAEIAPLMAVKPIDYRLLLHPLIQNLPTLRDRKALSSEAESS